MNDLDTYETGRRALGVIAGHETVSKVDPLIIEKMWTELEPPFRALAGSVRLFVQTCEGVAGGFAWAYYRVSHPLPYKRNARRYGR